jgi:hypothetical protein
MDTKHLIGGILGAVLTIAIAAGSHYFGVDLSAGVCGGSSAPAPQAQAK